MSKEDFNNALNHIDYDLVEEYVAEKERIEKKVAQKRTFIRFVPIAACFVIIFTFSITLLPMVFNNVFDNKNVVSSSPVNENFWGEPPITDNGGEGVEDEGISDDVPEGPSTEIENNGPNYSGAPTPGDALKPSDDMLTYSFQYEGLFYTLSFNSLEEMYSKAIGEDSRGNYITSVNVYNNINSEEVLCPIYEYAGTNDVIIELFDGHYFIIE